ncbi:MAG: MFS transporter [Verrucomicrobiae bacterium]|nr:MFS transporter [Verrucomicrobiae bacterium]
MRARVLSKVTRRLLPFMLVLYVAAYLDRINVGFAALEMKKDLAWSDTIYGLGAGLFFVGYFLFEIPSNLILERVGARLWIARIMISWGLLSSAMMFVKSAEAFYVLRFLLGAAEAGFFPGMLLYLTYWFPAAERARAMAQFITAAMLAWIVGGPVSGLVLRLDGLGGLQGWQWLFLLEGLPSVVLGLVVLACLVDRPSQARWLTGEERDWLERELRHERLETPVKRPLLQALREGKTWLLALVYFLLTVASYGFSLWLPQVIAEVSGLLPEQVGWLSAVPYALTAIGMVLIGGHSDRTQERRWHVALPLWVAAAGMAVAAQTAQPVTVVAALSVAAIGNFGCLGPFWALATRHLGRSAAAGGIALINSLGNLGGFLGPFAVGRLKDLTSGYGSGFLFLAGALLAAGLLALRLKDSTAPQPQPSAAGSTTLGTV